jgi:hypothetical protein
VYTPGTDTLSAARSSDNKDRSTDAEKIPSAAGLGRTSESCSLVRPYDGVVTGISPPDRRWSASNSGVGAVDVQIRRAFGACHVVTVVGRGAGGDPRRWRRGTVTWAVDDDANVRNLTGTIQIGLEPTPTSG